MPSDPLEAELLAMAGAAIGVDDNLLGIYKFPIIVSKVKKILNLAQASYTELTLHTIIENL